MTIKDHLFIVISGDNGNALGVIRSIGEAGIKPILIYLAEESHIQFLVFSKYLSTIHVVQSYEEGVNLLLDKYSHQKQKPFVYSCDDSLESILDHRFEELYDDFYFFHAGEKDRVNALMDKHEICRYAESCGLRIPRQVVVKKGELPVGLSYPIITKSIKSIVGGWKSDSFICHDETELLSAYDTIASPVLLIEEYIEKKNELTLEGFSVNNGKEVFVPLQITYLRIPKGTFGHYLSCSLFDDETLRKQVTGLIQRCRFSGCFEIEFLLDTHDQLWFLEVNFRFSFWNYPVTFSGLNYPLMWAESTVANRIIRPEESSYTTLPIKESFTAMNEPGDFGQSVIQGKYPISKWLRDIRRSDMLFIYNSRDKRPAFHFWINKIIRKFRRKRKS